MINYDSLSHLAILSFHSSEERPTLQNITFECSMVNRMLVIVGPVGAGKVRMSAIKAHRLLPYAFSSSLGM